jgi:hypothetical protein
MLYQFELLFAEMEKYIHQRFAMMGTSVMALVANQIAQELFPDIVAHQVLTLLLHLEIAFEEMEF